MISAIIFGSLSLLANIVGISIPYWIYISAENEGVETKGYSGLWKRCLSVGEQTRCETIDKDLPSWFLATRAMELIGMVLMVSSLACALLKMIVMKGNVNLVVATGSVTLVVAAAVLALVAGISMLIGTLVFAAKTKQVSPEDAKHLHAGFGLCIAGGILAIIDSVVLFKYKSNMREASYSSI